MAKVAGADGVVRWHLVGTPSTFEPWNGEDFRSLNHWLPAWPVTAWPEDVDVQKQVVDKIKSQRLPLDPDTGTSERVCAFIQDTFNKFGLVVLDVPPEGNCGCWTLLALLEGKLPMCDEDQSESFFSRLTSPNLPPNAECVERMMKLRQELSSMWNSVSHEKEWQYLFEQTAWEEVEEVRQQLQQGYLHKVKAESGKMPKTTAKTPSQPATQGVNAKERTPEHEAKHQNLPQSQTPTRLIQPEWQGAGQPILGCQ